VDVIQNLLKTEPNCSSVDLGFSHLELFLCTTDELILTGADETKFNSPRVYIKTVNPISPIVFRMEFLHNSLAMLKSSDHDDMAEVILIEPPLSPLAIKAMPVMISRGNPEFIVQAM
jgi:hypothetical protein